MLKKMPPLILSFLTMLILTLTPRQEAAAWDRVCLRLPLGKVGFSATFHVVHGFAKTPGKLPSKFYTGQRARHHRRQLKLPNFGDITDNHAEPAQNKKNSPKFSVNKTRCISIAEIPDGEPFFVYMKAHLSWRSTLCKTHHTNPNPWYVQQSRRPYGTLEYEAWGTVNNAGCEFKRERR